MEFLGRDEQFEVKSEGGFARLVVDVFFRLWQTGSHGSSKIQRYTKIRHAGCCSRKSFGFILQLDTKFSTLRLYHTKVV